MFSVEAGHASAARLVRAGITGIVCGNDPLALGAIRAGAGGHVGARRRLRGGYDDSA